MRTITRSPSLRIQAPQPRQPASLRLVFTNKSLPTIFTYNKVLDINCTPLQLVLVDDQFTPITLPYPIKLEIVAVDGKFAASMEDQDHIWSVDEFNRNIQKEREGKCQLLAKNVNYTIMRDSSCLSLGEIEFTDNSSWTRSRRFKLGARVITDKYSHGVRILEALTDAFIVKDHRGELYKKHYPPKLGDEVWRLEKISKDGKFHTRLASNGVHTVQDFLKKSVIDQSGLKTILDGKTGISGKKWKAMLEHARTCNMGNKLYMSVGSNYTIILNPICEIVSIKINGQLYFTSDLSTSVKEEVDELVKNAYENWNSLQEMDIPVNEILQFPKGNVMAECSNHQQRMMGDEIVIGGIFQVDNLQVTNNNLPLDFADWDESPQNLI